MFGSWLLLVREEQRRADLAVSTAAEGRTPTNTDSLHGRRPAVFLSEGVVICEPRKHHFQPAVMVRMSTTQRERLKALAAELSGLSSRRISVQQIAERLFQATLAQRERDGALAVGRALGLLPGDVAEDGGGTAGPAEQLAVARDQVAAGVEVVADQASHATAVAATPLGAVPQVAERDREVANPPAGHTLGASCPAAEIFN